MTVKKVLQDQLCQEQLVAEGLGVGVGGHGRDGGRWFLGGGGRRRCGSWLGDGRWRWCSVVAGRRWFLSGGGRSWHVSGCGGGSDGHVGSLLVVVVIEGILGQGLAAPLVVQPRVVPRNRDVAVGGEAKLALVVVGGGALRAGPGGADGDGHVSREASQLGQPRVSVAGAVDVCPEGARDATAHEAVVSSPGSVVCDKAEEGIDGGVGPEGRRDEVSVAICKKP